MTSATHRRSSPRWALWLVLALACGLRFWQLGGKSLWGDELDTLRILMLNDARGIIRRLYLYHVKTYVNPPLYFLLAKLTTLDSVAEARLRLVSAVSGTLAVACFYGLSRQFFTRVHALPATLVFTLSPVGVYYSQDARPYALFLLESTAAAWLLLAYLRQGGRRRLAGLLIAVLLALYTSYVTLMLLACLAAATLAWVWARRRRLRRDRRVARRLRAGLFYLPWLPATLRFLAQNHDPAECKFHLENAWRLYGQLFAWPGPLAFLSWLMLGLLIWLGWSARPRRRAEAAFLTTLIVSPVPLLFLFQPYHYHFRHVIFLLPFLILAVYLAGLELARRLGRTRRLAVLGLAFYGLWLADGGFVLADYYRTEKENWRAAAAWMESRMEPGDAIIPGIYFAQDALTFYHRRMLPQVTFYPEYLSPTTLPRILERHRRVWFVTSCRDALPDWFKIRLGRDFRLDRKFPGSESTYVYLYEAKGGAPSN
jgi:4-amino-4-deoxy-L-arabinose transferase-like glycosyltransferase